MLDLASFCKSSPFTCSRKSYAKTTFFRFRVSFGFGKTEGRKLRILRKVGFGKSLALQFFYRTFHLFVLSCFYLSLLFKLFPSDLDFSCIYDDIFSSSLFPSRKKPYAFASSFHLLPRTRPHHPYYFYPLGTGPKSIANKGIGAEYKIKRWRGRKRERV